MAISIRFLNFIKHLFCVFIKLYVSNYLSLIFFLLSLPYGSFSGLCNLIHFVTNALGHGLT